ncbi:MAG: hypothetical protein II260_06310 [Muribaculaceae bacterium]|nr:hypothetical protein [Muribaculaceae bacterium]
MAKIGFGSLLKKGLDIAETIKDKKETISKGLEIVESVKGKSGIISKGVGIIDAVKSKKEVISKGIEVLENPRDKSEPAPESVKVEIVKEPISDIKQMRTEIEADNSFNETLTELENVVKPILAGGATNPEQVKLALTTLKNVAEETVRYSIEQETRREEIRAMKDIAIARIQAIQQCIQTYMEKTFDERSAIFAKQFECVDAALKSGDNDMLALSLNSINSLAASSPFKNLADINQVQKSLTSSDTEWDI